jgi:hypothetical protein
VPLPTIRPAPASTRPGCRASQGRPRSAQQVEAGAGREQRGGSVAMPQARMAREPRAGRAPPSSAQPRSAPVRRCPCRRPSRTAPVLRPGRNRVNGPTAARPPRRRRAGPNTVITVVHPERGRAAERGCPAPKRPTPGAEAGHGGPHPGRAVRPPPSPGRGHRGATLCRIEPPGQGSRRGPGPADRGYDVPVPWRPPSECVETDCEGTPDPAYMHFRTAQVDRDVTAFSRRS